jgi:hypothetical protein
LVNMESMGIVTLKHFESLANLEIVK